MAAKGEYPIPKFHFRVEWGNDFRNWFYGSERSRLQEQK